GIGTVHAFNIVTVKTRVDGHLDRIAFVEGQEITEGEVLAQIDARPFQAQLAQARAAKARNEALLANAKLDLERATPRRATMPIPCSLNSFRKFPEWLKSSSSASRSHPCASK